MFELGTLHDKFCTSCQDPLMRDGLLNVRYEEPYWYHRICLERAKHELADAMFIAKLVLLNQASWVYQQRRDDLPESF